MDGLLEVSLSIFVIVVVDIALSVLSARNCAICGVSLHSYVYIMIVSKYLDLVSINPTTICPST